MEALHYSLFTAQTTHGEKVIFNLDSITSIFLGECGYYYVNTTGPDCYPLDPHNGQALIAAWDNYKATKAAIAILPFAPQTLTTAACRSASRIDQFLHYLAQQDDDDAPQKSIKALLREEEVYL